ncbi:type IV conjugative transfer system lipoprotein TraV [Aromatoleum aromaticum]|uniref:Similar to plasmid-like pilus assembly protein traV n=1 Tax=Aromatoleum aromaticum (strain DSM 19018 / LMG 30748 / EbN1) TaxID=76114 RepID=Q5NYG1_AROAE|nr:type IV conjugative transfer system lipoprotein TraV [Aromatoleum aromaticum]NMG56691.1 type IV conjugative transfer system lipoprotein TraV [Aromatoleum aromaticum]CAI09903.1 similar to plasmid-like pilus assembly protein traV [Aromatoleum aromaticum EbN1]
MKTLILRIATACLLLPLGACMNMSGLGGDSKYACKAPEGVACDSVSGTYANALHHNLPSQRARRSPAARQEESDERAPQATTRAASPATAGDAGTSVTPSPLRSQARVLRLWIKPWEDADGDLYDQGYVYVQVDNGQWLIDHVQRQIRDAYAPLKPPPKSAPDTATESNPGGNSPAAPSLLQRPTVTGPGASRAQ